MTTMLFGMYVMIRLIFGLLVVLAVKNVWHFLKLVSFQFKLLDYFQLVWHLLMLFWRI